MVLDKNVKFGHNFIFRKIRQKSVLDNSFETENALGTIKRRSFYFSQNKPKNVFEYILKTKNAFKTIKTRT